jgi:hypothetical protein
MCALIVSRTVASATRRSSGSAARNASIVLCTAFAELVAMTAS